MKIFEDYAYYYNMFYGDKDYRIEALDIKKLFDISGTTPSSILNVGCGTGRHDFELHKLGYKVHGIDLSNDMIRVANDNYGNISGLSFEEGDSRNYITSVEYDAVVSLFHVMSYQNSNDDIINSFRTAHSALKTGGVFLFDVWYGPGVLSDKPVVRVKEVESETYKLIRTAKPIMHANENIVDVYYNVFVVDKKTFITQEIKEKHGMRYYFAPEICFYLKSVGFELVRVLDCNTLNVPDYNSWTAYFIAIKK